MRSDRTDNHSREDAVSERLSRWAGVAVTVLGSMLLVARPLASQLAHYMPDSAFSGLIAALFVCAAGVRSLSSKESNGLPRNLLFAAILWIALFIWGAAHSPFLGASIPLSSDAILYVLVLLGGYLAGRNNPKLRTIFIQIVAASAVIFAFAAIWQVKVDLPRLRNLIKAGEAVMPDALNSKIGLDRLNGDEAFVTFGNPNSLAAYLIVGFFLLIGIACSNHLRTPFSKANRWRTGLTHAACAALILVALFWTSSKGGTVALLFGCWFFALQRLSSRYPVLKTLTIAGVVVIVMLLCFGTAGIIPSRYFGLSMQVRFEYWKSGLAMWRQQPFAGVGVGGYGEWYSVFKTPLGWESKDPHNEFISLLAELGVLGPAFYALIWWLLLKHSASAAALRLEPHTSLRALRWRDPELLAPFAGMFSFMIYIGAFGTLNASDIFTVLQGEADRLTVLCALQTLALPFLFLIIFFALRDGNWAGSSAPETLPNPQPESSSSDALMHGFRAAAGAILMHQLVDFDFKAQGVMVSLFFCGGCLWGAADSVHSAVNTEQISKRTSAWITVACGLLIIPTAFWIPFYSGLARSDAQELQSYLQMIRAHPEKARGDLSAKEATAELLAARARAIEAAPFDSEALVDRALSRLTLESHTPFETNEKEVLDLLNDAVSLRPLSAQPQLLIASLHLHRALASGSAEKHKHYERALEAFSAARRTYPLNPSFAFMTGDVLLLMGEPEKACADYWHAFAIDMRINDPNVYISAIFSDPRPGVFSRHGCDMQVLAAIDQSTDSRLLRDRPDFQIGLLARKACAVANRLNVAERSGPDSETARLKKDLLITTRAMSQVQGDVSSRAHAALLNALCLKEMKPSGSEPPELRASKADIEAAREYAQKLQTESVQSGEPGTLPTIFDYLMRQ